MRRKRGKSECVGSFLHEMIYEKKKREIKACEVGWWAESPLGISLEVKPGVTLDIPANGLDRSLSG